MNTTRCDLGKFLQCLAFFAFSLINHSTLGTASENDRIIVIGAGIAGISAAKQLQDQGRNVIVLEARGRLGGRIHTSSLGDDTTDLGATWLNGDIDNPVAEAAKRYHIKKVPLPDITTDFAFDSVSEKNFLGEEIDHYSENFFDELKKLKKELDSEASMTEAADAYISNKNLTGDQARHARWAIEQFNVEIFYAGPANQTSLKWFDEDEGFKGDDYGFPNGYEQIVRAMSAGLKIDYNMPVNKILYDAQEVIVEAGDSNYRASQVIVTVPLGVLKSGNIEFEPTLPSKKQQSIDKPAMGTLEKVVLQFDTIFWPSTGVIYIDEPMGRLPLYMDISAISLKPTLVVFHGGNESVKLISRYDDESIKNSAIDRLAHALGKEVPEPANYLVTRWSQDPYALGSYAYVPVGASPSDMEELASPLNDRVFFAGEATSSEYYGQTHGAMISGLRAADEVLAAINNRRP
ncbi:MAG: flavin monoamine oxidase family protein [Oligoflexales bacterium]